AGDGPHGRRLDAEGHLEGQGRCGRVDSATGTAGWARDEDRVAGVASLEDHLVAAEQGGHRIRLEDLAALEVDHGVKRERAGDPRDRIEIHLADVAVALEQLLELRLVLL